MSWIEPTVEWRPVADSARRHEWLIARGELLVTWPPSPFEDTATDCFRVGREYWISQPGVGAICFFEDEPRFLAFPSNEVDQISFAYLINRSWLPVVYQVWGRQVLHASAVVNRATGDVVAFAGPTHAGKSTMAYGLAHRRGWEPVCDDTLAFSAGGGRVVLHPLPNEARLRAASAAYYGRTGDVADPVVWPEVALQMAAVYFLNGDRGRVESPSITRLRAAESYPLLLGQAYALTLKLARHNQRLMRDYLALAAVVPVFLLEYCKSFDAIEQVLDLLETRSADGRITDTLETIAAPGIAF